MAEVALKGVRKSFGSTPVVHGVDIGIADGEFCVLAGPSGCGKSTLLRMIAGLEEITGGEISIGGRVVNDVQPKERDIAMRCITFPIEASRTISTGSIILRRSHRPSLERPAGVGG